MTTDAERANYWKMRALSEQLRRQDAEAQFAVLEVRRRVLAQAALLGIDPAQGNWEPDDERECFILSEAKPVPQTPEKPKD